MNAEAKARYIVREFCGYEPADVIATVAAALAEAHAAGREEMRAECVEKVMAKAEHYRRWQERYPDSSEREEWGFRQALCESLAGALKEGHDER